MNVKPGDTVVLEHLDGSSLRKIVRSVHHSVKNPGGAAKTSLSDVFVDDSIYRTDSGLIALSALADRGWRPASFVPKIEVEHEVGRVVVITDSTRLMTRLALAWAANDGSWDVILPEGKFVGSASDPVLTFQQAGYVASSAEVLKTEAAS